MVSASALRALPVTRLLAVQPRRPLGEPGLGFVADGVTLNEGALMAIRGGRGSAVPLLIGFNSDEATLVPALGLDARDLGDTFARRHPSLAARIGGSGADLGQHAFQLGWFEAPTRVVARAQAQRAPVWLYRFDYVYQARDTGRRGLGHGEELPLVFASLDTVPPLHAVATARDRRMAGIAVACWANFARTGNPDGGECPPWPRYDATGDRLMRFGSGPRVERTPEAALLDAIERDEALGGQ